MFKIKYYQIEPKIFDNPIFSIHMKGLRWYGFLIGKNQKYPLFHFLRSIFFTLSIIFCNGLMFAKVTQGLKRFGDSATSIATAFLYLSTSIMVINAYFQRKRVYNIVTFIHNDLKNLTSRSDSQEGILYANTIRYLRTVTIIVWSSSVGGGLIAYADCLYRTIFIPNTVFNVAQILNGTAQPVILFRLYPYGELYDNLFVGYILPCYSLYLGVTTIPVWHTFMTCLMQYVILKLEIINKRMSQMDISKIISGNTDDIKHLTQKQKNNLRLKLMEFCINEQIKIRAFVKEFEQLVRIPVFFDFLIFSMLICFLFYALSSGNSSNMDYFFMFVYLFVMTALLWLYHWHASLILKFHNDMCFAIYASNWYNYPLNLQRTVRMLMLDSMSPLIMRAVIVELNLRTFISVLRGAYSYFNILRSMN